MLGASRIAESSIVGPAAELGHRLVAVAARNPERAAAFADKYGVERVVASYQDVIDDPEVDVVYNPLANSLHAPWNLAAIAAGKPVLTEKPFARDQSEARRVADAAETAGVTVMEGFHYYFHPVTQRAFALAVEGTLGELTHVEVRMAMPCARRRRPPLVVRHGRRRADGPRLLRLARHADAGPAVRAGPRRPPVSHAGPRRTAHPRGRRLVRRRARIPRRGHRAVREFDGGRTIIRSPSGSSARRASCWCTTSSSPNDDDRLTITHRRGHHRRTARHPLVVHLSTGGLRRARAARDTAARSAPPTRWRTWRWSTRRTARRACSRGRRADPLGPPPATHGPRTSRSALVPAQAQQQYLAMRTE